MHELSLAQGIIQVIEEELGKSKEKGIVRKINLRVGKLSFVEPEALVFSFEFCSKKTQCENAKLVIEKVPLNCKCQDCGKGFSPEEAVFICPDCNSSRIKIISGEEFCIDSFEIE
ncbi:MAG TPA: hydrogenase maturation nickel metallochaperone HypA [Terriglobales bacterium]|nr:hydrogenase maturation nickel metallochaperone HypA [Terriglobales bacterium]